MASFKNTITAILNAPHLDKFTVRQFAMVLAIDETRMSHQRLVTNIAARLGVRSPAITRAADKLTAMKYTYREAQELDRRCVEIQLTERGKHLAAWLKEPVGEAP